MGGPQSVRRMTGDSGGDIFNEYPREELTKTALPSTETTYELMD